jgi:acetyltransferase-like isoleucine patch superfamily enzyme
MIKQQDTQCGISSDEFERFTRYCNQSDNLEDNRRRAQILGFTGVDVKVAPGAIVRIRDRQPGNNVFIGLYTYINGDVTIGNNVLIGPHCSITAGHHQFEAATASFSGRTPAADNPIHIGDGSWLASGVVVTAGVNIGRANLLCANCVVTKSTPDFAIMAGIPAKQIGRIDPETGDYIWFNKEDTKDPGDQT